MRHQKWMECIIMSVIFFNHPFSFVLFSALFIYASYIAAHSFCFIIQFVHQYMAWDNLCLRSEGEGHSSCYLTIVSTFVAFLQIRRFCGPQTFLSVPEQHPCSPLQCWIYPISHRDLLTLLQFWEPKMDRGQGARNR